MPEYRLRLDEGDVEASRPQTLQDLCGLIDAMNERPLALVTLEQEESMLWDQEGGDYQDELGRLIVEQVDDGTIKTLVIRDRDGLPLALAAREPGSGWQGVSVDRRLRTQIAALLRVDEDEFY